MNLNESDVRETMDSAVHKGYVMARQKVATMMSSVIKTNASSHSVEAEITQIIDQLYETWVAKVFLLFCLVVHPSHFSCHAKNTKFIKNYYLFRLEDVQ